MKLSNLAARHRNEALRALTNHRYEKTDGGIEVPSMKLTIGGVFSVAVNDGEYEDAPNMVVTEGLNHILSVALAQGSAKAAFYIALFSGNITVANTLTAATFPATATEFTNYTEATRVLWDKGAVAAGAVGNTASPAVFTMNTGGGTIRGCSLMEASAKSATTGVCIAAARLPADKVMAATEELRVKYSLAATST